MKNSEKFKTSRKLIKKNPKLIRIRYDLRTILNFAIIKEYERPIKLMDIYREKERKFYIKYNSIIYGEDSLVNHYSSSWFKHNKRLNHM